MALSNDISVSVNGGATSGWQPDASGMLNHAVNQVTAEDFLFGFTGTVGIAAGDLVTLSAGTVVFNISATDLPTLEPTEAFMANLGGQEVSGLSALDVASEVPEPASLALVGMALLGLGASRRSARSR